MKEFFVLSQKATKTVPAIRLVLRMPVGWCKNYSNTIQALNTLKSRNVIGCSIYFCLNWQKIRIFTLGWKNNIIKSKVSKEDFERDFKSKIKINLQQGRT